MSPNVLELHYGQAWDSLEVAKITRGYTVAEFHGRQAYQQISEWKTNASGLILAINLPGAKSDWNRDRMDGHRNH